MSEKIEDILRDEVLRALIPEERERLTQALDSQDTLGESEECFFKAFHGNPDSYTITDLKTGELVEVNTGFECGIGIEKFNDIKLKDVLEFYTFREIKEK